MRTLSFSVCVWPLASISCFISHPEGRPPYQLAFETLWQRGFTLLLGCERSFTDKYALREKAVGMSQMCTSSRKQQPSALGSTFLLSSYQLQHTPWWPLARLPQWPGPHMGKDHTCARVA